MATTTAGTATLTDVEKARIREEMILREEIRRELSPPREPGKRGVHGFLNSPFFLTVVCGLAASGVSQFYVRASARNERILAHAKAVQEKKTVLITSVANDLPTFVSVYASMLKRHRWLRDPKNESEGATDEFHRPREEVYRLYVDLFKMYLQARKPESILADVKSTFESEAVADAAKREMGAIDAIGEAKTDADVKDRTKAQEPVRAALLDAMAAEIRQPIHGD